MGMSLVKNQVAKSSSEELKQKLIDCITREKENFMSLAKQFYSKNSHTAEEYIELTRAIIAAVDQVLEVGDWKESLFLRNVLKPLQQLREEADALQAEATDEDRFVQVVPRRHLKEDEVFVYISVFQSEGDHLEKWGLQLASLKSHLLGRPIYESEEDIQKIIRQKLDQHSEGYVVVAVKSSDIQESSHQMKRVDRYGNPLITLKETAVKVENIFEFVCQGSRYFYQNGRLIPQKI